MTYKAEILKPIVSQEQLTIEKQIEILNNEIASLELDLETLYQKSARLNADSRSGKPINPNDVDSVKNQIDKKEDRIVQIQQTLKFL